MWKMSWKSWTSRANGVGMRRRERSLLAAGWDDLRGGGRRAATEPLAGPAPGVCYLTVSGLVLTETLGGDNPHPPGGDGYGPMFPIAGLTYCGDAVHLQDAAFCIVQDNQVVNVGGNGVYLEGGAYRNVIRRNEVGRVGVNGICLLGNEEKYPLNNRISDNRIHHVGVLDKYSSGVFLGVSGGNLVEHNLIEDVPHHAVNLGNNGFRRNFVEYNDIRRPAQELSETAAINCWMEFERVQAERAVIGARHPI